MSRAVFLGVDGGGTKTRFVLVDEAARVVADVTGPSCAYLGGDIALVGRVLTDGVDRVTVAGGVDRPDIVHAFFGLPSFGEVPEDVAALRSMATGALGHERCTCENDVVAGWAGAFGGANGVHVVSGTGSIAYGVLAGAHVRAGGWGDVFGDEGSGYWTAVQGLNAFSRMADGRLPIGPLLEAMRTATGAATPLDVIGAVLRDGTGARGRIAALSRVVTAAAAAGDAACADIVERAGLELAALAGAVRTGLGWDAGEPTPVSYSGGMFQDAGVLRAFTRALGAGWALQPPLMDPAIGAAVHAMRIAEGRAG